MARASDHHQEHSGKASIDWLCTECSAVSRKDALFLFYLKSWKYIVNIFAQGAPNCEEVLEDAYALKKVSVRKVPAQQFSLTSSLHPCFLL